jgi:hypothetical protein
MALFAFLVFVFIALHHTRMVHMKAVPHYAAANVNTNESPDNTTG